MIISSEGSFSLRIFFLFLIFIFSLSPNFISSVLGLSIFCSSLIIISLFFKLFPISILLVSILFFNNFFDLPLRAIFSFFKESFSSFLSSLFKSSIGISILSSFGQSFSSSSFQYLSLVFSVLFISLFSFFLELFYLYYLKKLLFLLEMYLGKL